MPDPPTPQGGLGQSWFVLDFEAAYAGDSTETPQQAGGGSEGGFYGPIGQRVRFSAPFAASLARQIEVRAQIRLSGVRKITASAPMEAHAVKRVQFSAAMVREEATVYAQMLREDDEIVMILATM